VDVEVWRARRRYANREREREVGSRNSAADTADGEREEGSPSARTVFRGEAEDASAAEPRPCAARAQQNAPLARPVVTRMSCAESLLHAVRAHAAAFSGCARVRMAHAPRKQQPSATRAQPSCYFACYAYGSRAALKGSHSRPGYAARRVCGAARSCAALSPPRAPPAPAHAAVLPAAAPAAQRQRRSPSKRW